MKGFVVRITIVLIDAHTPIWRRVIVPATFTLADLHTVIQAAMGWYGYHLHHFAISDVLFGDREAAGEFGDKELQSELDMKVGLLAREGERLFSYVYDYGDNWSCAIVLEAMYPALQGVPYPCLDGGEGASPPEDVGGVWGYDELVAAFADPKHDQHEEAIEQLGKDFDAEIFDNDAVAEALATIVKPRARSRKRPTPSARH
ncbi:MAG: plasmid pRiA4b ORF-3 family protein [Candidatus Baltobacteraceae bacterium]